MYVPSRYLNKFQIYKTVYILTNMKVKKEINAKMGLFHASKGGYPSFFPEIYSKFPFVLKNGSSCSSLGTQIYGVELGLVDSVSG